MGKRKVIVIPVYLFPEIGLTRCELIPGISLQTPAFGLSKVLDDMQRIVRMNAAVAFKPNYVIVIDSAKYVPELESRLQAKGMGIAEIRKALGKAPITQEPIIMPLELSRHVLMSLILLARVNFSVGGSYGLVIEESRKRRKYHVSGYSHARTASRETYYFLSDSKMPDKVDRRELLNTAKSIEVYYRQGMWLVDRMAIALSSLWAGVCSPYLASAFLSLTIVLEALLSTRRNEITHMLGERTAVLLGRDERERVNLYEDVRKLYGLRSKLVHGNIQPRKGTLTMESLFADAKRANVPHSSYAQLHDLAIKVIRAVLKNRRLLQIIQSNKSENKINEALDAFYLKLLFK